MPGRPRKPFVLHEMQGTARSRVKKREAGQLRLPPGDIGEAPEWFNEFQRAEWQRVTTHPELRMVLSAADRPVVEHHCVLYERFMLDSQGERNMSASERQCFHSIQMQLGWTPASRSKVVAPEAPKQDHEWAI